MAYKPLAKKAQRTTPIFHVDLSKVSYIQELGLSGPPVMDLVSTMQSHKFLLNYMIPVDWAATARHATLREHVGVVILLGRQLLQIGRTPFLDMFHLPHLFKTELLLHDRVGLVPPRSAPRWRTQSPRAVAPPHPRPIACTNALFAHQRQARCVPALNHIELVLGMPNDQLLGWAPFHRGGR